MNASHYLLAPWLGLEAHRVIDLVEQNEARSDCISSPVGMWPSLTSSQHCSDSRGERVGSTFSSRLPRWSRGSVGVYGGRRRQARQTSTHETDTECVSHGQQRGRAEAADTDIGGTPALSPHVEPEATSRHLGPSCHVRTSALQSHGSVTVGTRTGCPPLRPLDYG